MRWMILAVAAAILRSGTATQAQVPPGYPADYGKLIEAAKRGRPASWSIRRTDAAASNPLLKDFAALYPGIRIDYTDMNSTELYSRFIAEVAVGSGTADLLWSSAMDLQVKLVADGNAATYASPEIPSLPKWAVWRNQAYGTTYEPITFVYNKRLVPAADVPQDHAALLDLLNTKAAAYKDKITAYDPEKSGVGYLFVNEDVKHFPQAWDLFRAMGKNRHQALHLRRRHDRARHVGRAHHCLRRLRFVCARALEEGADARGRDAEGLHARHLARGVRFGEGQEPECRAAVPRLSGVAPRRK